MSEIIKIFIGADEYGEDFPSLAKLRKKSLIEGFCSFRNWINLQENLGDYPLKNVSTVLRGGYTGICVAHSIEFLLRNDVDSVLIDLPNCRYDEKDLITNSESINMRLEDIVFGIRIPFRNDPRLKFKTKP